MQCYPSCSRVFAVIKRDVTICVKGPKIYLLVYFFRILYFSSIRKNIFIIWGMILTPKFQFNLSYFPPFQRFFFKKTPRRRHTRSVVISKRVWTCYKSIHVLEVHVYRQVAPFFNKYGIIMVFWNEIDHKRIISLLFFVFFIFAVIHWDCFISWGINVRVVCQNQDLLLLFYFFSLYSYRLVLGTTVFLFDTRTGLLLEARG